MYVNIFFKMPDNIRILPHLVGVMPIISNMHLSVEKNIAPKSC